MDKKLVYVDTDVGLGTPGAEIDDGAALIFLLRHPRVEILGAGSVFGNVPLSDATSNLDRLLTWMGRDELPFGMGAEKPLVADIKWFEPWQALYGKTLPWDGRAARHLAANLLIHLIREHPGQISILSLGPMTNLALAIRLDPGIVPLTREVIVMGGSFNSRHPTSCSWWLFCLVMGCFLSVVVIINITVTIIVPILAQYGIDPLYFGLIMIVTLMIGVLTPPFGNLLFAIIMISGLPFEEVVKAILPPIIPILVVVVLLILFPPLTTFLPSLTLR